MKNNKNQKNSSLRSRSISNCSSVSLNSSSSSSNLQSECINENLTTSIIHYVNAQSPSTIWRRQAEKQLLQLENQPNLVIEEGEIHTTSILSSIFVLIKSTIGLFQCLAITLHQSRRIIIKVACAISFVFS